MKMFLRGWLGLLALTVAVSVARTRERQTIGGFLGEWKKVFKTTDVSTCRNEMLMKTALNSKCVCIWFESGSRISLCSFNLSFIGQAFWQVWSAWFVLVVFDHVDRCFGWAIHRNKSLIVDVKSAISSGSVPDPDSQMMILRQFTHLVHMNTKHLTPQFTAPKSPYTHWKIDLYTGSRGQHRTTVFWGHSFGKLPVRSIHSEPKKGVGQSLVFAQAILFPGWLLRIQMFCECVVPLGRDTVCRGKGLAWRSCPSWWHKTGNYWNCTNQMRDEAFLAHHTGRQRASSSDVQSWKWRNFEMNRMRSSSAMPLPPRCQPLCQAPKGKTFPLMISVFSRNDSIHQSVLALSPPPSKCDTTSAKTWATL